MNYALIIFGRFVMKIMIKPKVVSIERTRIKTLHLFTQFVIIMNLLHTTTCDTSTDGSRERLQQVINFVISSFQRLVGISKILGNFFQIEVLYFSQKVDLLCLVQVIPEIQQVSLTIVVQFLFDVVKVIHCERRGK